MGTSTVSSIGGGGGGGAGVSSTSNRSGGGGGGGANRTNGSNGSNASSGNLGASGGTLYNNGTTLLMFGGGGGGGGRAINGIGGNGGSGGGIVLIYANNFVTTTGTKRGIIEMINEGYIDLTSGYTGCVINYVTLECEININGSAFTQTFIVTNDSTWKATIESILSSIPEVGDYNVDLLNNTLQIKSNCQLGEDPLGNSEFLLLLNLNYDIDCAGIIPTPTPTATPTPTPTPAPTTVNFAWFTNGPFNLVGSSTSTSACSSFAAAGCGGQTFYTSTPTITNGTIIYADQNLTTPAIGSTYNLGSNGWGWNYLSNDCPVVGLRYVVQVNGSAQVVNNYQC